MRLEVTRKTDLATRALLELGAADSRAKAADLAARLGTTPGFLSQVIAPLVAQGWVRSEPGPTGGYRAMVSLDHLSLRDVIEAVEGPTDTGRCVLEDRPCGGDDDPCRAARPMVRRQRPAPHRPGGDAPVQPVFPPRWPRRDGGLRDGGRRNGGRHGATLMTATRQGALPHTPVTTPQSGRTGATEPNKPNKPAAPDTGAGPRSDWRSVAVPTEHGGWGLTLEPVVLGLAVTPSLSGALLGMAALTAFVARTPLRVVLVDHHRSRDLARTSLARRILAAETILLAALGAAAAVTGDPRLWLPALVAVPLVAVELSFDMRSRSRRLLPELAGSIGVASVVAMIVLAGGGDGRLATGLWLVLAARALTSVPFVRDQVARLHQRTPAPRTTLAADAAALGVAAAAAIVDPHTLAGTLSVPALVAAQRLTGRRPPARAVIVGVRQVAAGFVVVLVTAVGVRI